MYAWAARGSPRKDGLHHQASATCNRYDAKGVTGSGQGIGDNHGEIAGHRTRSEMSCVEVCSACDTGQGPYGRTATWGLRCLPRKVGGRLRCSGQRSSPLKANIARTAR